MFKTKNFNESIYHKDFKKDIHPRGILSAEIVGAMPKVDLHQHIDGSLRPKTIIELAEKDGIVLPYDDEESLKLFFHRGAHRGSLSLYLEGFGITTSVLQTPESLFRAAFEVIEDNCRDGVVYSELRFAPVLHIEKGLSQEEVVEAVIEGLENAGKKFNCSWGLIICAMRHRKDSLETAQLAVKFRDRGAVGFDLAGEEAGYPAKEHIEAFNYCKKANFNITVHAGEAFGVDSIWQALQYCGAHRIGHGTKLVEDMSITPEGNVIKIGKVASYVLDHRIPLEVCLSSNIQTGAAESYEKHPFRHFHDMEYRVFLNTDNTLMSDTSMSGEFLKAVGHYGLTMKDLEKLTVNAMKSAFLPYRQRNYIIYNVIKPGYKEIRKALLEN
ncbi:adenosine deaminase [candidate division WOR-3 bacterium]|nr:adenosine deaminase [candidate division WOR-3 bacterium]